MDTYAAAAAVGVSPSTIRGWASAGDLRRLGHDRKGRSLYDYAQVLSVAKERGLFRARTV